MADSNPVGPDIGVMQAMEPMQAQQTQTQAQPMPQQNLGNLFPSDDDTEGRKQRWEGFFEKIAQEPGAASFLAQLGSGLMQPLKPGESAMAQLGQATQGAIQGQQQMAQQQAQQEAQQAQQERADEQVALQREQFEESKRQFEVTKDMEMRKAILDQLGEEEGGMEREAALDMANDIVTEQMNRDRMMLGDEEFSQKWGSGGQIAAIESLASRLAGRSPSPEQDTGVPFTGRQLMDAGVTEMEGVGQIDPNETYQMPTSWVQQNFGRGTGGQREAQPQQPQGEAETQMAEAEGAGRPKSIQYGGKEVATSQPFDLSGFLSNVGQSVSDFFSGTNRTGMVKRFSQELEQGRVTMPNAAIREILPDLEGDEKAAAQQILGEQVESSTQGTIQR